MDDSLDKKNLKLFNKLGAELNEDEKRLIHFKSVSNFIYHLIFKQSYSSSRKNIKLQELGEIRIKKYILEYLNFIDNKQIGAEESSLLYEEYIFRIGDFMVDYYKFSGQGGKLKILNFLIVMFIGAVSDSLIYLFSGVLQYSFISLFVIIYFIRLWVKYRTRKLYGFFY